MSLWTSLIFIKYKMRNVTHVSVFQDKDRTCILGRIVNFSLTIQSSRGYESKQSIHTCQCVMSIVLVSSNFFFLSWIFTQFLKSAGMKHGKRNIKYSAQSHGLQIDFIVFFFCFFSIRIHNDETLVESSRWKVELKSFSLSRKKKL